MGKGPCIRVAPVGSWYTPCAATHMLQWDMRERHAMDHTTDGARMGGSGARSALSKQQVLWVHRRITHPPRHHHPPRLPPRPRCRCCCWHLHPNAQPCQPERMPSCPCLHRENASTQRFTSTTVWMGSSQSCRLQPLELPAGPCHADTGQLWSQKLLGRHPHPVDALMRTPPTPTHFLSLTHTRTHTHTHTPTCCCPCPLGPCPSSSSGGAPARCCCRLCLCRPHILLPSLAAVPLAASTAGRPLLPARVLGGSGTPLQVRPHSLQVGGTGGQFCINTCCACVLVGSRGPYDAATGPQGLNPQKVHSYTL